MQLTAQGWKLHVSATELSAARVLAACAPILVREGAPFKAAAGPEVLGAINSGQGGATQIGKFLTVYTNGDQQAVRVAQALDEATRGMAGPRILSERRLRPGSLVHYRYGSFGGPLLQTPLGEIVPALIAPDGTLFPDRRGMMPPPWVTDPFDPLPGAARRPSPKREGHGLDVPPSSSPDDPATQRTDLSTRLLANRYVITFKPYDSPRGALYIAADSVEGRCCIAKRARRWAGMQPDGRDATDRLRAEAGVLRELAPSPYFPAVYDLIEEDGDLYLIMEDVGTTTLEGVIRGKRCEGRLPTAGQVRGWGVALADALAAVHCAGFVYGDVKPSNVILQADGIDPFCPTRADVRDALGMPASNDEDVAIALIDFDVALPIAGPRNGALYGTRGYTSPQHVAGEPASVADDVYGLGALLYDLVTGADPAASPSRDDLLSRPILSLRPDADLGLASVIERCLEHDPSRRYTDMTQVVEALLAQSGTAYEARPLPRKSGPECAEMARRTGDALCRAAIWRPEGGCVWASRHHGGFGVQSRDINTGLAGTALALAELVDVFHDPDQTHTLAGAARSLLNRSQIEGRVSGLYVGEGGVAAALLRAAVVLEDEHWPRIACDIARRQLEARPASPDLYHGWAGLLRMALIFFDATSDRGFLDHAMTLGYALVTLQDGGLWTIPAGYGNLSGTAPLGYAHGAAGIACALLDLYDATGARVYRDAACGTAERLRDLSRPCLEDGAGLAWPPVAGKPPASPFWCHGATGIGQFMLHAAQVGIEGALDAARRCGLSAARGARWANPVQCHGLAGNIEFLLDLYQATGDKDWLEDALALGELLATFAIATPDGLVWPSEQPHVVTPDYMVGYAGVAVALLRLASPRTRPRQMTRAGFRKPSGERAGEWTRAL